MPGVISYVMKKAAIQTAAAFSWHFFLPDFQF